jgi:hypothetical protein
MLLFGIPLILPLSLLPIAYSAGIPRLPNCVPRQETKDKEECARPIEHVVAVVPGSHYVAKIECKDCPYKRYKEGIHRPPVSEVVKGDHILVRPFRSVGDRYKLTTPAWQLLNVTLSHDNRTVLFNDEPLYPLPTIPTPTKFWTKQYSTNFSNADLASSLSCPQTNCDIIGTVPRECDHWCRTPISSARWIHFDYLYITNPSELDGENNDDADSEYWDVSLDIFGKSVRPDYPVYNFDEPEQKRAWMLIKGTPVRSAKNKNGGGKGNSDLFDSLGGDDKVYEYQIVDMRLVPRAYTFPAKKPLTLFRKIGHFFGTDIWQVPDHRFLYISSEWGEFGKKGTLRDLFGEIVHWEFWDLFAIIAGSVSSGLIALFAFYRLFWWIVSQRELMKWDGMEDVWENIRRERVAEEEGALLNGGACREGGYRDDPEDGGEGSERPPAYMDTPMMKPLPSKPLPETPTMKPLPEVPLIDA